MNGLHGPGGEIYPESMRLDDACTRKALLQGVPAALMSQEGARRSERWILPEKMGIPPLQLVLTLPAHRLHYERAADRSYC